MMLRSTGPLCLLVSMAAVGTGACNAIFGVDDLVGGAAPVASVGGGGGAGGVPDGGGDGVGGGGGTSLASWARVFGDAEVQLAHGVALDGADAVVVVGAYEGLLDPSLPAAGMGRSDAFAISLGHDDGTTRWTTAVGDAGTPENQVARSVVSTPAGVSVAGSFQQSALVNGVGQNSNGAADFFVWRLTPEGELDRFTSFSSSGDIAVRAIESEAEASFVGGQFAGQLDLAGSLYNAAGPNDGFAARIGAQGDVSWAEILGGSGRAIVQAIALSGPDVIVAGSFDGTMTVGGSTAQSAGGEDGFVAALGSGGALRWLTTFGGTGPDRVEAMVIGGDGRALITGSFSEQLGIPPNVQLESAGSTDIFLLSLDVATGDVVTGEGFGGPGLDAAFAMALDDAGTIAIGGVASPGFSVEGRVVEGGGGQDALLLLLGGTAGAMPHVFGDADNQRIRALAFDADGALAIAGRMEGTMDIAHTTLVSQGDLDAFVALLRELPAAR